MIVIFNIGHLRDPNFYYLGGFEEEIEGILFYYGPEKKKVLITSLDKGKIEEKEGLEVIVFDSTSNLFDHAYRLMEKAKSIGINYNAISADFFHKLKKRLRNRMFNVHDKLKEMRKIKREDEIDKIRDAGKITVNALEKAIDIVEEGVTEAEIAGEFAKWVISSGGSLAFTPIVAFGKNTLIPHYSYGDAKLKRGDAVLIDVGARYKSYVSDISISFNFGKSKDYTKLFASVIEALEAIEDFEEGDEVRKIAEKVEGIVGKMPHAIGHGIGIEVHEDPLIYKGSKEVLKEGMVFAVEPAIYKHIGIRVEEDFAVIDGKVKKIVSVEGLLEKVGQFF